MTETISTQQVVTEFRKRLAENPGCAMTHYNLGIALIKLHQWDDAAAEFLAAIAESPELAEAYINLSGICFQKAIEIAPRFAVAHNNLAVAYLQMGDPAKATEHCKKALEYGYEVHPELLEELGVLRNSVGRA